ncbi:oxidoreductase [Halobacteriales archaeon SW_8_65_20]|nr:MAG: oxidoreductase [Halobacteriales archaeon SW_8_65_20]
MNVLVTGGCGYIGSVLVPLLQQDERVEQVTVLDDFSASSPRSLFGTLDDGLTFYEGDVREDGDVESACRGVDTVIHLAAITGADSTHDRRAETFATNVEGTRNVLNAAGKMGVGNVVLASSCNIYGRASSRGIDESVEPEPLNPYAETKHESESLLREATAEFGFDGTALRLATNYGHAPGVRFNLVVNQFVFRALTDRPLTVYGDGTNWRPFIHVRDAARAYKHAALAPGDWNREVYNVGANGENYQIATIADIVSREVQSVDISYLEDERPGPSYHVDFDRLAETGYETEWTLREGVRDLRDAFRGET